MSTVPITGPSTDVGSIESIFGFILLRVFSVSSARLLSTVLSTMVQPCCFSLSGMVPRSQPALSVFCATQASTSLRTASRKASVPSDVREGLGHDGASVEETASIDVVLDRAKCGELIPTS